MLRLPVRTLAEMVHRRGDLHARLDGRTRAEEGISAQRRIQAERPPGYQRERPVSLATVLAGREVTVSGRIDGCELDGDRIVVEEFKTTRADPEAAHAHHAAAHWAQARLYAGLLTRELDDQRDVEVRLLYCHPETLEARTFRRTETAAELAAFLELTLREYGVWLARQLAHETRRDERIRALAFPFPEFRPFQRAMARRTYRALRDREHLLLEAPTGSGKTAATLYPAVRALESSGYQRLLFLTSRTTGARAVGDAVRRLDPDGAYLRHVTILAREKACFVPGTPCEPDACRYARGYYDRSRTAVVALLERRALDPQTVAEVAREHQVCPFELSLDAACWCDLVVADYNYVFDPVVRLQRLTGDAEAALLVDEAHQLAPRVRDMLSLAISRPALAEALAERPPAALARRLKSVDRALVALKRTAALAAHDEQVIERPQALLRSMQRLVDEASSGEWLEAPGAGTGTAPAAGGPGLDSFPATRDVLFNCHRWIRSDAWYEEACFRFLGGVHGRDVQIRLACIDPSRYIRERLGDYGGHVRFSGTLSPLPLYARLHGEAEAPAERAGNPFRPEQLRVLVVHDVPVYLRQRRDSLAALAALIRDVAGARVGHYLVAFPSFEYLTMAADAFEAAYPHAVLARQRPALDEAERAAFIEAFDPDAPARLGFVVLGGVFGESVDFARARLAGVICVGVGLPPPSRTRQELERHFSAEGLDGGAVAYTQPAMVKVLQMAGRLLRSPADRGVLCLVDRRFRDPAYQQFFPDHWQPSAVRAREVAAELAGFWGDADATSPPNRGAALHMPGAGH